MIPFQAPVDDILFSLRHVAQMDAGQGWDDDMGPEILAHFAAFAEGELAPLNAVGDAQGARLEKGRVIMPDGFRAAFSQLAEGGWQGLTVPEDFGGMGASAVVGAAVWEVFSGANHAMQMVCNLVPGAVTTLLRYGTAAQQARWIPALAEGRALSTMCLTEPGAGSDLGRIRTRAVPEGDGWRIDGEKIFISGGDQDLSDAVLHLVLARTGTPDSGVKGLSLFICAGGPGVTVTRLEEKMGLHASPTCQMVFDGAEAELVGAEGDGLRAMFTLMNHARIDVALQGVAHASRAAQIAQAYAAERVQGRKADGSPALLTDHADVQRMLDRQVALAMGARGMCHVTLKLLEDGGDADLCAFLTSVCKLFGSEAGMEAADLGMQVLGGYGYLREYGLEQVYRDARVTTIYEGTSGIHARTLSTRGLGAGADGFAALIQGMTGQTPALAAWEAQRDRLRAMDDPAGEARAFAEATADLFLRAVWTRIAAAADQHGAPEQLRRVAETVLREVEG